MIKGRTKMIEETVFTSEKIKSWQCYLYSINENKYYKLSKKDNIPVPEYIKTITGEYILSMKTKL